MNADSSPPCPNTGAVITMWLFYAAAAVSITVSIVNSFYSPEHVGVTVVGIVLALVFIWGFKKWSENVY